MVFLFRFWTDIWLDGGGLKGTFPTLYGPTTDNDCLVADAILNQGGWCDFKEILAIGKLGFLSASTLNILEPTIPDERKNGLTDLATSKYAILLVKSYFSPLLKQSGERDVECPWKILWKSRATCFGWLAIHNACLMQDALQIRGFSLCIICLLCERS